MELFELWKKLKLDYEQYEELEKELELELDLYEKENELSLHLFAGLSCVLTLYTIKNGIKLYKKYK